MKILAAIVLAPIGLGVLIFGGILAVAVGMSFAGAGSGVRSGDQPLAVVGTIVGAGEAVLGLLAVLV